MSDDVLDGEVLELPAPQLVPQAEWGGRPGHWHGPERTASIARVISKAGEHGRALELRAEGHTYAEIANLLNQEGIADVTAATISNWVKKDLAEHVSEPVEEVRRLEHFRLEQLIKACWGRAVGGHGESVDRVLRVMERKAKLLGLDAPAEIDIRELRVELFAVLQDLLPPEQYQRLIQQIQERV